MINESIINSYVNKGYAVICEKFGGNVKVVYTKYGSVNGILSEDEVRRKVESINPDAKVIVVESILG